MSRVWSTALTVAAIATIAAFAPASEADVRQAAPSLVAAVRIVPPQNQTVRVGSAVTLKVAVYDTDTTATLALHHTPLPANASMTLSGGKSPTSWAFKWTPLSGDLGKVVSICLTASDDKGRTSTGQTCFDLTVAAPPPPPSFTGAPPNLTLAVGTEASVPISVADSDPSATVTVSSTPLPTGAVFAPNGSTHPTVYVLKWTPAAADAGKTVMPCFTAHDSNNQSSIGQWCIKLYVAPQ